MGGGGAQAETQEAVEPEALHQGGEQEKGHVAEGEGPGVQREGRLTGGKVFGVGGPGGRAQSSGMPKAGVEVGTGGEVEPWGGEEER